MRVLVMIAMLLVSVDAISKHAISAYILSAQASSSLLPNQSARVSNKEATSSVKQQYKNSKILSINLIQSKGPPVYKVKTLSSDGVVKYVFVDGTTGDVFE
jgi:uncharacterized membrane protein YkoI